MDPTTQARDVIADFFARTTGEVDGPDEVDHEDTKNLIAALSAAGLQVVPTALIDNAEPFAVEGVEYSMCPDDYEALRVRLAASVAEVRGHDPLQVFDGKP